MSAQTGEGYTLLQRTVILQRLHKTINADIWHNCESDQHAHGHFCILELFIYILCIGSIIIYIKKMI